MAIQDCTRFLGKRVGYWAGQEFSHIMPRLYFTGVIVACYVYAEGYEKYYDEQVLFLLDGEDEPDFIGATYDFELLSE